MKNLLNTKTKILVAGVLILVTVWGVILLMLNKEKASPGEVETNKQGTQSKKHEEDLGRINSSEQASYQKGQEVARVRQSMPVSKPTFDARYSIENGSFIVKPSGGADLNQAKNDFNSYLKQNGVSDSEVKVIYNTSPSDYFVIKSNIDPNKLYDITDEVTINFSDPIDRERTVIKIGPDVAVFYNFNDTMTQVKIKPRYGWGFDQTIKITVSGVSKRKDATPLNQDYTFSFKTVKYGGI